MTFDEHLAAAISVAEKLRRLDGERLGLEAGEDRGYASKADVARIAVLMKDRVAPNAELAAHFAELERAHHVAWTTFRDRAGSRLGALAASNDDERLGGAAALYHWNDWRHAASPFQDRMQTFGDGMAMLEKRRAAIDLLLADQNAPSAAETNARKFAAKVSPSFSPVVLAIAPRDTDVMPFPSFVLVAGREPARHIVAVFHGVMVLTQGPNAGSFRIDENDASKEVAKAIQGSIDIWQNKEPGRVAFAEAIIFVQATLAAQIPSEQWAAGIGEYHGGVRAVRNGHPCDVGVALHVSRGDITLIAGNYRAEIKQPTDAVHPAITAQVRSHLART